MKNLPWLRLYTDTVDNEKIRLLAFEDRWHFIALLCLKQQGVLDSTPSLLERKISVKLGIQLRELDEIKRRLIDVELIGTDWNPIGWENRQYKSDSSSLRVRKYRENKKIKKCNGNETLQKRNGNAIDTDTDTDTEIKDMSDSIESYLFDSFWESYPRKDAKKKAKAIFNKLSKTNQQLAINDLQKRYTKKIYTNTEKQYIPLPTTYLNGERWNDDLINNGGQYAAVKKSPAQILAEGTTAAFSDG